MDEYEGRRPRRDEAERQDLAGTIERVGSRLANAFVLSALLIGLAVYFQGDPPRYQIAADGDRIVRLDMRSGTVIACEDGRCARILRRGQELESRLEEDEPDSDQARLPAPAPAQEQAPAVEKQKRHRPSRRAERSQRVTGRT